MAQFARPDSNVTQTSFTGGFADIDEASASDADFAYGANNIAAELEVGLSNVTDPGSSSGHTFRYRIARTNAGVVDGGGNAVTVTARLLQGATQIATDAAQTATGTWTGYSLTLSGAEADAITDYTDLRLEFLTSASGGSPAARRGAAISWAELEVPDAGAGASYEKTGSGALSDVAAGADALEIANVGAGILVGAAIGADALEMADAGAGVLSAVAGGAKGAAVYEKTGLGLIGPW